MGKRNRLQRILESQNLIVQLRLAQETTEVVKDLTTESSIASDLEAAIANAEEYLRGCILYLESEEG